MAGKKSPPTPDDIDPKAKALRQALEAESEKLKLMLADADPKMGVLTEMAKVDMVSPAAKMIAGMVNLGPQIEGTRQAIENMLPGVQAAGQVARQVDGILESPSLRAAAARYWWPPVDSAASISTEALKPREDPVLKFQREAAGAMAKVADFQERTLIAMDKQAEALQNMRGEASEQTRLAEERNRHAEAQTKLAARQMRVAWIAIAISGAALIAYIIQVVVSLAS